MNPPAEPTDLRALLEHERPRRRAARSATRGRYRIEWDGMGGHVMHCDVSDSTELQSVHFGLPWEQLETDRDRLMRNARSSRRSPRRQERRAGPVRENGTRWCGKAALEPGWLESSVDQMLTRDALDLEAGRDPVRLRRYFEAYALNTASIVEEKTVYEAAGVSRKTALAYDRLLKNLLVVEALPAWTSNRLKRLTLAPKRHSIDTGLLVGALGIDLAGVMSDGDLLGRVLESFVTAHLRAEASYTSTCGHLYHRRTEQGRQEIDLVAEFGGGKIVGMEVKATSAPNARDAAHLAWLRDRLGARFVRGVVMHTGPRGFELGERIVAAPISALWRPG